MQRVQVAQPALAVLDVRLDLVARLARPAVALVALCHLGVDEGARGAAHDLDEAALELGEELRVAVDEAGVEQRGADREVARGHLQALADGARGVPDLEAEVPQHVEHVFGDALAPRRLLVGQQEQDIDVGAGASSPRP